MTKKLIGYFGVDSGQVLITDPCYLKYFENNEFTERNENDKSYSYSGACNATLSKEGAGEIGLGADGVAISTGYGDGSYPVYATYEDGRVKKVEIVFF